MRGKRIAICLMIAVLAVLPMFRSSAAAAAETSAPPTFTEAQMKAALADFIGDGSEENTRVNRTSFRDGERAAAAWLEQKLLGYGYRPEGTATSLQLPFTHNEEYKSQNVTAVYPAETAGAPQIILCANYDNLHSEIGNMMSNGGAGAMQNGTGVAILLTLAEALQQQQVKLPFDVRFVFFGASEVGLIGSNVYLTKQMSGAEKARTVLAVNFRRIGGDYTYLYADEVKTDHGALLLDTAKSSGLAIKAQPKSTPFMPAQYVDTLPYVNWGMLGDQSRLLSVGLHTVSLYGGNLETLSLSDIDGKAGSITYTSKDTIDGLEQYYPAYGVRMAEAAQLVYNAILREDFLPTCLQSAPYDYTWLTKPVVVSGIVIGVLILMGVAIIVLVKIFEKKYPLQPLVRHLKIAVFGMDYETPDEENIYVDIQPKDGSPPDPFD